MIDIGGDQNSDLYPGICKEFVDIARLGCFLHLPGL